MRVSGPRRCASTLSARDCAERQRRDSARGIDDLYTFPLEVNVSTYDFDLSPSRKQALYESANSRRATSCSRTLLPVIRACLP